MIEIIYGILINITLLCILVAAVLGAVKFLIWIFEDDEDAQECEHDWKLLQDRQVSASEPRYVVIEECSKCKEQRGRSTSPKDSRRMSVSDAQMFIKGIDTKV